VTEARLAYARVLSKRETLSSPAAQHYVQNVSS
jgi:hypothetical protein